MCRSKVPDRTAKSPYKRPQHQQPRRASTSSNGKGGGKQFFKKKTPKKHPPKQKAYKVTFKPKIVLKEPSGGENAGNVSNSVLSGKGSEKKVCITGFLALQFTVKWFKVPMLRLSPARGCTQTQTQTIGLK